MSDHDGFVRRLGVAPKNRPGALRSDDNATCPDVFEMNNGDFAVIGTAVELSAELRRGIAALGGVIGDTAQVVIVPRGVLALAKADIPDE